jgi:PAS domain S-box-containing protein
MIGGMTDLTGRKQTEEKLREQATLLDKAQDAILVRDLEHRITFWNKSAERLYGWSADEAAGRSIEQLLYRDSADFEAATAAAVRTGEWVGDIEQYTKTGHKLVVEGRWTLVRDDHGTPRSILSINTDVTEKKRIEAHFLRAQRMESIGTLAGGIAHDLNNILAPILMSVTLLQREVTSEDGKAMLDTLQSCSLRAADLVRQVLSFARGVEGRRIDVQPAHLVREIQKIVRETFPKNIVFRSEIQPALWAVTGDPTQLHQVFMNLCVNARDAMPQGGTLLVTVRNIIVDEACAGMNPGAKPGAYTMVKVEDTGTGIPPALRDRIFEPFFTTKETGRGSGLGLSTTVAIVRSHGGFIDVYSEPDRGTEFKVYLPAHPRAAAARDGSVEKAPLQRGHGELVLLVDDEEGIRKVAKRTLEQFGYRVVLAADGAEAVAIYAAQRSAIAVVLTDMAMPVMDGSAAITALKAMNPQVRIIGSSGLASPGGLAQPAGAGVVHFISKPYTAEKMLSVLAQILHEPS